LPNARPALVTVGAIALVSTWNAFLWPLLVASNEGRYTLTVGMGTLIGQYLNANWGTIMGGAALLMLPMVIFFLATQRHFLRSLALSGLK
jgi:multiple sugar transport system permease protein